VSGSSATAVGREQEAQRDEVARADSLDRSHPRRYVDWEYRSVAGQLKRSRKILAIRGLSINHNHDLKNILGGGTRAVGIRQLIPVQQEKMVPGVGVEPLSPIERT